MTALNNIVSQEIVQKLGWALVHFIWQAALVALILAFLLRLLRRSAPNMRYMIACLTMVIIVTLPVITICLVPTSARDDALDVESAHPSLTDLSSVKPAEKLPTAEALISTQPRITERVMVAYNISWKERFTKMFEPVLPYMVFGWLVGVLGLSVWHLGGWVQLQRLRKKMIKQVDVSLQNKLKVLVGKLRINRTVQLLESALVQVPTVIGWLRPTILLPASALTGLSTEQLEAMLAHELAHIKRYDYLVNMLQTIVEILGFYHPAVWWISQKIRAERENCCDDLAVSISGDRVRYARALTLMEEIRASQDRLAIAASGGSLLSRIRRLVGKETGDNQASWIPSVITILLIATMAIPTAFALSIRDEAKAAQSKETEANEVCILRFPKDRSMGKIFLINGDIKKSIDTFYYWVRREDWQYFADATGDVAIPMGSKVWLRINDQTTWRDLSPLTKLQADDLCKLSIHGSYTDGPKPGNSCTKHFKHLTGLRILELNQTYIGDMSFIENLTSLEYLTVPERITDAGIAKVAKLPCLKGLYFRENRVTNEGLRHLAKSTSLEELSLGGERIGDAGLVHLTNLPNLRYLLLMGKNFTDSGMAHLKNIHSLRILHVGFLNQLTDAALPYVAGIPNLEAVSFHWSQNITDQGIAHLKKMRSLRKLDVMNSKVTDKGIAHLAQIKSLESLELSRTGITDVGLKHISELTNLKKLSVARSHYVDPNMNKEYYTDKGLQALTKCVALEELNIGSIGITDAGMEHIVKLPKLRKLNLFGCDNVTDKGLAKLAGMKSLMGLDISYADITVFGLAQLNSLSNLTRLDVTNLWRDGAILDISGLTNLEDLSLGFSRKLDDAFIDADLMCLRNLKKLKWLQIYPREFTDVGMAYLTDLTNMEGLGIGGSKLTDNGLKYLVQMKKLYHLTITDGLFDREKGYFGSGGSITDAGLRHLGQIKPLGYLNITADKDFTPAAVRRLRTELPHLSFLQINGEGILPASYSGAGYGGYGMGTSGR